MRSAGVRNGLVQTFLSLFDYLHDKRSDTSNDPSTDIHEILEIYFRRRTNKFMSNRISQSYVLFKIARKIRSVE